MYLLKTVLDNLTHMKTPTHTNTHTILYLLGVHANRHLPIQVAFGDHVRAAGMDHSGWLQGLHKPPADRLVSVTPCHLLNTMQPIRRLSTIKQRTELSQGSSKDKLTG